VAAVALHAGESVGGLEERASGAVAVRVAVRAPAAGDAPGAGREVATSGVEARWSEREHVAAGELLAVFRASGPSGQRAMAAHLDRIARACGPLTDAATQEERLRASAAGHGPARDTLTVP
jgi:hypothetical protein